MVKRIISPRRSPCCATPEISHAGRPCGRPLRDSPLLPPTAASPPLRTPLADLHLFECVLLETPSVYRFDIEAPVAADFERRQPSPFELPIYRRRMNLQIVREFLNRQHVTAVIFQHL